MRRTSYALFRCRTKQRNIVKCVVVTAIVLFFTFVFRDENDIVDGYSEENQHVPNHDVCPMTTEHKPPFGDSTRDDLESEKGKEYFALQSSRQFTIPRTIIIKPVIEKGASVIILVCSCHGRQDYREAIRNTWGGDVGDETRIIFVVGNGDTALTEGENYRNGDILQISTDDSYRSIVLKVLAALEWINETQDAKYIAKIDDDEYVDVKLLLFLAGKDCLTKNRIFGVYLHASEVLREHTNKWHVPRELYPFTLFPPYITGGLYLMEMSTLARLLDVAEFLPIVPLEDVFITGIVARVVGIGHANHTLVRYPFELPCNFAVGLSLNNPDMTVERIQFMHRSIPKSKRRFIYCHYIPHP